MVGSFAVNWLSVPAGNFWATAAVWGLVHLAVKAAVQLVLLLFKARSHKEEKADGVVKRDADETGDEEKSTTLYGDEEKNGTLQEAEERIVDRY